VLPLFLLANCSHAQAPKDFDRSVDRGYQASSFVRQRPLFTISERVPSVTKLVAKTGNKICSFSDNILTYTDKQQTKQITLDVHVADATRLICSDDYTVIIMPKRVVVSLGAGGVLSGREMLGMLGERFVAATSYELNIKEPASEGITKTRMVGETLVLETSADRIWTIDLSDPFAGWHIY